MNGNIFVNLVNIRDEANIGAAARAMSNFGLENLRLINCSDHKSDRALSLSCNASHVLDDAELFNDFKTSISDCNLAIGFTRRIGSNRHSKPWEELAPKIYKRYLSGEKIAFVFGREDNGLYNNEIELCQELAIINTHEENPSLNLAQSVVIACYELSKYFDLKNNTSLVTPAKPEDVEEIILNLKIMLTQIGYAEKELRNSILKRWKNIFGRAGLEEADVGMIKGLLGRFGDLIKFNSSSKKDIN